jgi:hypothetical protein
MNPYSSLPSKSFWKYFKKKNFDLSFFINEETQRDFVTKKIASAGSCFAANVAVHLQSTSTEYLFEEQKHPFIANIKNSYNYESYSARYGNIYSTRQLLQLIKRAKGTFIPDEIIWYNGKELNDPFRPGINFKNFTESEFYFDNKLHLEAVKRAVVRCDTFIFTLGLTEVWMNKKDKSVYPSCPGVIAGTFDPTKYELLNLTVNDISKDLQEINDELQEINPKIKVLITVSPVPLVATANLNNIVLSNQYSKSKLLVAAHEAVAANSNMYYFPSYEMIIGSHTENNFMDDKRNVKPEVVTNVMKIFKKQFNIIDTKTDKNENKNNLSRYLNDECEEISYEKFTND